MSPELDKEEWKNKSRTFQRSLIPRWKVRDKKDQIILALFNGKNNLFHTIHGVQTNPNTR